MIINKTHTFKVNRKAAPFEDATSLLPVVIPSFPSDKNPNIFSIEHNTRYTYSSAVQLSKHLFRLQPVHDLFQTVLNYQLISSSNAKIRNFTGAFGNHASFIEINESYTELNIISQSIVCVSEEPSDLFDLLHQPRTIPMIWMPWDRVMMQAYLQAPELPESELFELSEYAMSFVHRNKNDIIDVLNDINQTIYRDFSYVPNETTLFTTPYEIYINRKGVCQDFALLFICLARLLDIPARYRVGYVYTGGDYENKIQSDASHAWVEVYLPYMGWVGFDPTNGCMAGKNHIRVACGRKFQDATPSSGTIFSNGGEEQLSTSVQVLLLNNPA